MNSPLCKSTTVAAVLAVLAAGAQSASPVTPFELGYRAWEVVTEVARLNGDPKIGGECSRTFRPFVSPGLRGQTKQEQDVAAAACVEAVRSVCSNSKLRTSAEISGKCKEFR